MLDDNPTTPFVERLTGLPAQILAAAWIQRMAASRMSADGCMELIRNAREHYTPKALAHRALNRVRYFDSKYPAPKIVTPGDREWPN